jgi:hypothetical protein
LSRFQELLNLPFVYSGAAHLNFKFSVRMKAKIVWLILCGIWGSTWLFTTAVVCRIALRDRGRDSVGDRGNAAF